MFENPKINIKLKLSALWTSLIALYIYGDYFELYVPGKVEKFVNGTSKLDSPTLLLVASILIAIPSLMIALSILLKPKINRLLNIIFGILLTLIVILVGSISLYEWYSFYVLYAFIEAIITISIVWTAWKWPKKVSD
jgi:uncharacterized protein DUF6326